MANSFKESRHPPVPFKSLKDGQQPIGGTLITPNFLAPRLYKLYNDHAKKPQVRFRVENPCNP